VALRIGKGKVSDKVWGGVDKSSIWQRLKQALQDGESGAAEAIREMYAVVKTDINADLTQSDVWGPHHEIHGDTLVLNRNGLIAAAQALSGARSDPDLTADQRREAARHLIRHYRDLEMEAPDSLLEFAGEQSAVEMTRLIAQVTGEMRVEDVSLAPWAQNAIQALKSGDEEPLEVVVEVPAGLSKRGWNYRPEALQRIVGEVMSTGLPGFLGHQKAENVDTEFPTPVTHWIGAKWENGKAYFRGLVDAAAKDLKRWIRAGVIRQVSIFGQPKLQQSAGEIQVVDYRPLSIDWTPLNRAGMPTRVVAMGEMDTIGGDTVVPPKNDGGEENVKRTLKEILAELKETMQANGTTFAAVAGEMGWQFQDVAQTIGGEQFAQLQAAQQAVGEMAELFGLAKDAKPADVVAAVKTAREAQVAAAKAQRDQIIDKVIGEMVAAEAVRSLVKRLLNVPENADEAAIKKAVGEMLEQPEIKQVVSGMYSQTVFRPVSNMAPAAASGQSTGLVTRRARI